MQHNVSEKKKWRFKKDGTLKLKVCRSCGYPNCDSMYSVSNTPASRKLRKRKALGLCIACGKEKCQCKPRG